MTVIRTLPILLVASTVLAGPDPGKPAKLALPGGEPGSGFDDLIDPKTLAIESIDGFSSQPTFAGGHGAGTTSVDAGGGLLFGTAPSSHVDAVHRPPALGRRSLDAIASPGRTPPAPGDPRRGPCLPGAAITDRAWASDNLLFAAAPPMLSACPFGTLHSLAGSRRRWPCLAYSARPCAPRAPATARPPPATTPFWCCAT